MSGAAPVAASPGDVIDEIVNIRHSDLLGALRAKRVDAATHIQGSYRELFEPDELRGVPRAERLAVALRTAEIHEHSELSAHYRRQLEQFESRSPAADETRRVAILRHADLIAPAPADAQHSDVERLAEAGLSPDEIVVVSQVVGFVSFQIRVAVALELIGTSAREAA